MGSCMSIQSEVGSTPTSQKFSRRSRIREDLQALAAEAKIDELISLVPGRSFSNGSSSIASLFTQQGRKGVNQDAMIVWEGFGMNKDSILCGVFDGHGPYGHLVARRVRDSLPSKLAAKWQEAASKKSESMPVCEGAPNAGTDKNTNSIPIDQNPECEMESFLEPEMFALWKDSYLKAYREMDKVLRGHASIDCFCSGTTAVTVLKQGQDLVIANVGDSRAVMGTKAEDGSFLPIQLTVDLKPDLPREAERISQCRGRVFALQDEPEVPRVWLPHENSPGLAMARAFGDFCLKDFGVIAVPEISYRRLTEQDQFIVLATDGIWDVLSNAEVVEIIATAPTRRTAARSLVECAVHAWKLKYPTSKIDDCAVTCLYLNTNVASHEDLKRNDSKSTSRRQSTENGSNKPMNNVVLGEKACVPVAASAVEVEVDQVTLSQSSRVVNSSKSTTSEGTTRLESERVLLPQNSLRERLETNEDEWSALEGITRVNSLLNLPRFSKTGSKDTDAIEQHCQ